MLRIEKKPFLSHWRFQKYFKFVDKLALGAPKRINFLLIKRARLSLRYNSKGRIAVGLRQHKAKLSLLPNYLTFNLPYKAIIRGFSFNFKTQQELVALEDFFGRFYYKPSFDFFYPGLCLASSAIDIQLQRYSSRGLAILRLSSIELNTAATYIYNCFNIYPQFVRSVGCVAFRRKTRRTQRLVCLELPSGSLQHFSATRFCYLGQITHYTREKQFFGKWGQSIFFKKRIVVRGVAKNPVDHPNGGRTKAKQPERSPWAWIAKWGR